MKSFSAIIEARMGSKRLPGKVMLKVKNIPMILLLVNRLKQVKKLGKIIVATTLSTQDDILCNFLKKKKIFFYRGSEENVLKRVLEAAKKYKVRNIVQITGDCPLIDPEIVSQVVSTFQNNRFDFVSNGNIRTYPDGMDVSVFSTQSLQKASLLTKNKFDLEHVTLFLRRKKKIFKQCNIMAPQNLHLPKLGLTLDEYKDYILISKIFKKFWKIKNNFSCGDVINFLNKNKNLYKINSKVKRKTLPLKIE